MAGFVTKATLIHSIYHIAKETGFVYLVITGSSMLLLIVSGTHTRTCTHTHRHTHTHTHTHTHHAHAHAHTHTHTHMYACTEKKTISRNQARASQKLVYT